MLIYLTSCLRKVCDSQTFRFKKLYLINRQYMLHAVVRMHCKVINKFSPNHRYRMRAIPMVYWLEIWSGDVLRISNGKQSNVYRDLVFRFLKAICFAIVYTHTHTQPNSFTMLPLFHSPPTRTHLFVLLQVAQSRK